MGLDKAMELVRRKPTVTGNKDRKGVEFTMHYRIKPSRKQLQAASW